MNSRFIPFLLLFSFLFSCTEMKVTTHKQYIKNDSVKKIALFEVLITKPFQPILPLLDAAPFNGKVNKRADEIMDSEKKRINSFRDALAQNMAFKYNAEIIFGKELQSNVNFEALKKKIENKNAMLTGNDNFPIIMAADGEFNAFPFEKGKVEHYFINNNYRNEVETICKDLNVDAIAINVSYLNFQNVQSFGISCNARLNSALFIFDKVGNTIGHASVYSKINSIRGKTIGDYDLVLDEYQTIIVPLAEELVNPKHK
jgi:hypothetical protein